MFTIVSAWSLTRFQVEKCVLGFYDYFSPKEFVLNEFLELSEPPIHFSNAFGRFLSIPDEFGADYCRTTAGLSAGLFFAQTPDCRHQFVESALKCQKRVVPGDAQHTQGPHSRAGVDNYKYKICPFKNKRAYMYTGGEPLGP